MTALDAFPLVAGSCLATRSASPRAALRAALWPALLVTQLIALIPVVFGTTRPEPAWMLVYRTVGSSFAACGLIAWRRRPDSRVGALMTAAGFGMFVWPVLSQVRLAGGARGGEPARRHLGACRSSRSCSAT